MGNANPPARVDVAAARAAWTALADGCETLLRNRCEHGHGYYGCPLDCGVVDSQLDPELATARPLVEAVFAEIERIRGELEAARWADETRRKAFIAQRDALRDCGQDGACAIAPGCARHWEERNRELLAQRDEARAERDEVRHNYQTLLDAHAHEVKRAIAAEEQLDACRAVSMRMRPVVEASIALRKTESTDVPGESIAELEANVPAAQRRTALALVRWRNAVDALSAPDGDGGQS